MCGIVGAVAQRNIVPILVEGLKRLEYRGYDSAGIAVVHDAMLQRVRSEGRVADLEAEARGVGLTGLTGIGHTRWATHGAPTERNAHPHFSHDEIGVVHNGIIENHAALRQRLTGQGYVFLSETDTEVIAHLIHHYYRHSRDLLAATRSAIAELEGAFAIAVICRDLPHRLVGARLGSPLLVGLGIEENFLASDASAVLPVTQRMMYLEEGDLVDLGLLDVRVEDAQGRAVQRPVHTSELSAEVTELGAYRHFMQKEIHEQPRAVGNTLEMLGIAALTPNLFGNQAEAVFGKIDSVLILACGTSYHAGLTARYWIEEMARLPVTVEIASEYRYRQSVPNPRQLVVAISQSGETADTLAAVKHARELGQQHALAICNVPESALMRLADLRFLTRAGPEIGVASTKAFTTQLVALYLLAGVLAQQRGHLRGAAASALITELRHLPNALRDVLTLEDQLRSWAEHLARRQHALFIGRGMQFPIALEGALKLKEISYIHAEAYAAGELKHGPLALVDEEMPVIALAPHDHLLEKMKSNIEEVRARKGDIYVLTEPGSNITAGPGLQVLTLPAVGGALAPIIYALPLQQLAYHAALCKGTDVDKPRNLAKSVTVE